MTDPRMPKHRDKARALRAALAGLDGDMPGIALVAAESKSHADVDRFLLGLLVCFTKLLEAKVKDPVGYLQGWIALELQAADDEEAADVNPDGEDPAL